MLEPWEDDHEEGESIDTDERERRLPRSVRVLTLP